MNTTKRIKASTSLYITTRHYLAMARLFDDGKPGKAEMLKSACHFRALARDARRDGR